MPFHLTIPAIDARLATQADLETLAANIATQQSQRLSEFITDRNVQALLRSRDAQIATLITANNELESRVVRHGEVITALAVRIQALEERLGAATEHVVHPAAPLVVVPEDLTTSEPAIGSATVGLVPLANTSAEPVAATAVSDRPAAAVESAPVVHVEPAPVVTITTEQLGTALRAMATRRSLNAVRQLMAARGFPNASAVPQEHRADLLAAINAA